MTSVSRFVLTVECLVSPTGRCAGGPVSLTPAPLVTGIDPSLRRGASRLCVAPLPIVEEGGALDLFVALKDDWNDILGR